MQARRQFAMKFQQFSAPVQAKGVEDTSFYRYNVLLSLNEVGGDPARFGTPLEEFHAGNRVRLERWPREMIATATHDTKRGEDARARLNVLSEMPDGVAAQPFSEWRKRNAVHRTAVDRQSAPDANDEYLFYQTLVGSWPAEPIGRADSHGGAARPRRAPARVHAEGDQGSQDAHQLDQSEQRVRGRRVAIRRDDAQRVGRPGVSRRVRAVRAAHRGRRHGELARAARAEGRVARRPRLLSGHGDLAARHGRSRQPPAGRLCLPRGDARRADALDSPRRICGPRFEPRLRARTSRSPGCWRRGPMRGSRCSLPRVRFACGDGLLPYSSKAATKRCAPTALARRTWWGSPGCTRRCR